MKRLICLLLCLAMLVLAGCEKKDTDVSSQKSATGEIDNLVADGKLDGIKFGLGADVSEIKAYYKNLANEYNNSHDHSDEDINHIHDEDNYAYYAEKIEADYTVIDISTARFYYEKGKEDKGIAVIATDSATFGFTPGVTTKYDVEDALKADGETINAGETELKFLAVRTEPVIVLRYEFGDYRLDYYFYDNVLITTVLADTSVWKIK